ncbi:AMIN domain-containing protein [Helicobacter felis]|uniref:Periplasmic protein n=1 Tax=Helicobacter felis (strain ATCC 49179 / CCUG 28539 / NCTC 12436 / CS1) TaxID=936155 RepID=E7AC96_HELFC|nr:AMIN domain-containing protein [Helicobacter felis]CBY82983.1 Putative periplasmic protein [Helicobacter felis ATCC 49179]
MRTLFILIVFALHLLVARDDPFEPAKKMDNHLDMFDENVADYFKSIKFTLPTTARVLTKITITYQDLDASIHTKEINIGQRIDWHYPLRITQEKAFLQPEESTYQIANFTFWIRENKLYLRTTSKIQRSFILLDPYRIVIDIDREEPTLRETLKIYKKRVNEVVLTTHTNFYRFAIALDGRYSYKIAQKNNYLIVTLY